MRAFWSSRFLTLCSMKCLTSALHCAGFCFILSLSLRGMRMVMVVDMRAFTVVQCVMQHNRRFVVHLMTEPESTRSLLRQSCCLRFRMLFGFRWIRTLQLRISFVYRSSSLWLVYFVGRTRMLYSLMFDDGCDVFSFELWVVFKYCLGGPAIGQ